MTDTERLYLRDVFFELLDRGREARREAESNDQFAGGRALAYYEVISHMVNQLEAFQIDRADVGLDKHFDPEEELL